MIVPSSTVVIPGLRMEKEEFFLQNPSFYFSFCKKCMKDSMYDMFINNYYTNFNKYIFNKNKDWIEFDEFDMQRYGFKEEIDNER